MKKISYRDYLNKDTEVTHAPFQPEMEFYNAIRMGHVDKTTKLLRSEALDEKKGLGILSKDSVRNMKYHFTISTAVIARECIKAGLPLSESYSLSDYYIQSCDQCTKIEEISVLHNEMCIAYAKKMQQFNKKNVCSKPVVKAIDYIYEHLNTRITLEDLSEFCKLSNSYLSRLFKKETGLTVSDYILAKKLETAKSMLAFSDYSIAEIAAALAFPSQSYMTNALKKECGLTPLQYRSSSIHS